MIRVFVVYEQAPDSGRYEQHVELCRKVPNAVFRHGPITQTFAGDLVMMEVANNVKLRVLKAQISGPYKAAEEKPAAAEEAKKQGS